MTEKDEYRTKEEEAQNTKEPDEGAADPTGSYGTPTREDIASGNFADPFASTEQGARERYEEDAREEALTGQEGGGQQGYDEQGGGTGSSYSEGGGQHSTEEILKGFQDKTQVPGEMRTEEEWMQSPLEQESDTDFTFGSKDLLLDHTGLPGMDELTDDADDTGAPGLPTGREGISDQPTGGIGYPAGTYSQEEGLQGTNYKPGDSPLEEFGKGLSGHFVPGQGLGPTNEMHRELLKGDTSVKEIKNPDGTTTKVYESEDGTKAVVKGDTTTTVSPDGTVTETKVDPKTGEAKTEVYKPSDPGTEGEDMTREEIGEWMEQKAGYDWLLQNATGHGPGGGEEVNPGREGGTEYGVSTGEATGAQDQQQSMVGNPGTDESSSGAKSGSTSGGDQGGYTDPTDDALSSGEMGLTEDPLDVQPSDASSLLEDADDEGGHGFTKGNFSAEQLRAAQWTLYGSEEEDTAADDTYDDAGI